jgi:hypothetical protein
MAVVYRHIRLDKNEPFYIGIGEKENRAYKKHGRSSYWNRIVDKYGYRVEILFDDLTWEEAQEKEIEFISLYGRRDLNTGILVNLTDGGENPPKMFGHKFNLGRKVSEQTRKKRSESLKGRTFSVETRKLKSDIAKSKGQRPILPVGFKHSEESKKLMSENSKGKIISDEQRIKISEANKGKKTHNSTAIMINEVSYLSISDASKDLGLSRRTISHRVKSDDKEFASWKYKI